MSSCFRFSRLEFRRKRCLVKKKRIAAYCLQILPFLVNKEVAEDAKILVLEIIENDHGIVSSFRRDFVSVLALLILYDPTDAVRDADEIDGTNSKFTLVSFL